jgi:prepilin-type N-terminal cleavage/methylation domain-containing protein
MRKRFLQLRRLRAARQSGMTMIELLIAMTVLAIGVAGILGLVLMAIATNARNKGDTTGTMLAQLVMEQIEMMPANNTSVPPLAPVVTDCSGAAWPISLAPGGANTVNGQIDWTQLPGGVPNGYHANFAACAPNNQWVFYDVRWNIVALYNGPSGPYAKLITVSARPAQAQFAKAANAMKYFAPPVTLRTIVGM